MSLADRIKSFFPKDAFENDDDDLFVEEEWKPVASLAAYESEICEAEKFVKALELESAVHHVIAVLPLPVALTVLVERFVPLLRLGPLGELGAVELGFHCMQTAHSGLAQQFFEALGLRHARLLEAAAFLHTSGATTKEQMSLVLSSALQNAEFPESLSRRGPALTWFNIRCLAMLSWSDCRECLELYAEHISPESLALLGLHTRDFDRLVRWALSRDTFLPLLAITKTPKQFHTIARSLIRPSKMHIVADEESAAELLKVALRLKQTYDIAHICDTFGSMLLANHKDLLAYALLAVAFAQKRVEDSEVTAAAATLATPLVRKVLPASRPARCAVIGLAASKIHAINKGRRVSGHVLWQLLLSLPKDKPLNNYAQTNLATLVVQRPYIEQIRYMALPIVTQTGVAKLLRWHVNRIVDLRRRNNVGWKTLQAKEDIQLLVTGMRLAYEKAESSHSGKSALSKITHVLEGPQVDGPAVLEHLSNDNKSIAAALALNITAELITHKNDVVAQQLLKMLGPSRISRLAFDKMLLNLVQTHPAATYHLVRSLLLRTPRSVSLATINEIMLTLIESSSMSESQLMNRFQTLRGLITGRLHREVSAEVAQKFVDALIASSKNQNVGSQKRLKWALEIAHRAGVPDQTFEDWDRELKEMYEQRLGFFRNT